MNKVELDIREVIKAYEANPSIHDVARVFHTSHQRISQLLKDNNVKMQNVGKKKDVDDAMFLSMRDDYMLNHMTTLDIAKKYNIPIKRLRKIFKDNDVVISKWNGHIKKEKIIKPKHIKVIDERPSKGCLLCDWKTYDVNARTNAYYRHFIKNHGDIDLISYIHDNPGEASFFKGVVRNEGKVECKICGKFLSAIDERHLSKHNITKQEYLSEYPDAGIISTEYKTVLQDNYKKMQDNPNWERFSSSYEREIQDFLSDNNIIFETHNRTILGNGKELDIFIPDKKIAIEFNGCVQHTEWFGGKDRQYHLNKTKTCNEKGIRLIHIFEDEYVYHKDIVLEKLRHLLEKCENKPKIMARKCEVKEILANQAWDFLNKYHIQGSVSASVYLGAFYHDELIGVMTFKQDNKNNNNWELSRFATNFNYVCSGIGGKLFKFFVRKFNPVMIKSFADRRWTINVDNNLYTNLGFNLDSFTVPEYRYYYMKDNKPERFHKFAFRKQTLNKKYGLPLSMTETEMVKHLGYDKIWDCGLIKYIWKKED